MRTPLYTVIRGSYLRGQAITIFDPRDARQREYNNDNCTTLASIYAVDKSNKLCSDRSQQGLLSISGGQPPPTGSDLNYSTLIITEVFVLVLTIYQF